MSQEAVREAIAEQACELFGEYVGEVPAKARTYVEEDLVVVVFEDTLTKGERVLAGEGHVGLVREMRRKFIDTMRGRIREVVEAGLDRKVKAMLGDHSVLPDFACAAFVLEQDEDSEPPPAPEVEVDGGEGTGGDGPSLREVQGEISRGFTALYKESVGRGPKDVRTYIADDLVAVLLTNTLTKVERTLADGERPDSVEGMRREFQSAISERSKELVEQATGRHAVAFMSDHSIEPDHALEVVLLDGKRWGRAEPAAS